MTRLINETKQETSLYDVGLRGCVKSSGIQQNKQGHSRKITTRSEDMRKCEIKDPYGLLQSGLGCSGCFSEPLGL